MKTTHNRCLAREAKVFVKHENGQNKVIRVLPEWISGIAVQCYHLYIAFEENPDYFGRILFDVQSYWIYDGEILAVAEQEQIADFIINYEERAKDNRTAELFLRKQAMGLNKKS